jgi:hypothetical protein
MPKNLRRRCFLNSLVVVVDGEAYGDPNVVTNVLANAIWLKPTPRLGLWPKYLESDRMKLWENVCEPKTDTDRKVVMAF